ncbi:hypothetical protein DYBT9275_03093 [Dyadobacter sp. CECT 9275]|uniref:Oxidoreductase molybdopterin-binding domain-containing protein n=1 Tax=Dyadobacter helix TaxID=2822344 RepID=A0A916JDU7_9BACT|nr:molybdopterin-dependent oxidoreductase [Dyadobacter sp. CECT 9275]CAG5003197.1 hypothetical protein DYBT9275_03093 [Dyadobacter sp. CECT 9275]
MSRIKVFLPSKVLTVLSVICLSLPALAQQKTILTLTGEVALTLNLTVQDLAGYSQVTQKVKDRDGKEHDFKGVALIQLLQKAGVTTGSKLRGENLTKYLLISAADGYEVLYALAEADPEFTDEGILLATEKDGKPLPNGEGPFRIIAPHDKKPARWIREVRSIKVVFAKN